MRKVLHMTNENSEGARGYRAGPEARVVLHRHASRGSYAVAVVLDEGPFTASEAAEAAEKIREEFAGVVSKATAARRLGISERSVDVLREKGLLRSTTDETKHVLVDAESLATEMRRRWDATS